MSIFKYKESGHIGLFEKNETSEKLSKLGNPLEKLHNIIDFEIFRKELEAQMLNENKKNAAGCKPYDVVMMFKIILLKRFYSMNNFYIHSIGFQRVKGIVGLINLVYNMCRSEQIVRLKLLPVNKI